MSNHTPPDTDDSLTSPTSPRTSHSTRPAAVRALDEGWGRGEDAYRRWPKPGAPPPVLESTEASTQTCADELSEGQAAAGVGPEAATGVGSTSSDEVSRAVEFLTLLGASSLGTADAREDRLRGREHLEKLERAGLAPVPTDDERVFDLQVASELDWRGQSFEAELRYRATLRSDRPERLLTPLALLLEAKGRTQQALPLYVHAAQAREPNALFRLATISHQLGEHEWSRGFVELGSASLEPEQVETVATTLNRLYRDRATPDLGAVVTRSVLDGGSIDAGYALGTVLLTSGNTDLARLTLCTALGRGHSLAALSLLDQRCARRPSALQSARRVLSRAWTDGFGPAVNGLRRSRPGLARLRELGAAVATSVAELGPSGAGATVPADGADPVTAEAGAGLSVVQRALLFTRTVMTLRGLRRIGHDPVSMELIDRGNAQLCHKIRAGVESRRLADESALIVAVWRASGEKLERVKVRRLRLPQAPAVPTADRVLAAGVAQRYGHGLGVLTRSQRRALILDLAGASRDQIGAAMGLGVESDVRGLINAAARRLQAEQQGEQFDPVLWGQVEACLAEFAPDVAADLARRPELETGRSPTRSSRR